MPLMYKENTLNMEWCLDCHRAPEEQIRPREEVFNMNWSPPVDQIELGRRLVEQYDADGSADRLLDLPSVGGNDERINPKIARPSRTTRSTL